ncbi:MAG: DMT family transporter [Chloroflexi bacterium]|nr:DMT family transporter [Chloroflexota bacterium]
MTGILFALGASTVWGMANVWIRLALRDMRPTTSAVFSLFAGLLLLIPLSLVLHWSDLTAMTVGAIVAVFFYGMSNFLLGRFLNYSSISRIGLSRSVPIVSASPVPALLLAILLLGEEVNLLLIVGAMVVLSGVLLIVTERR